MALEYAHFVFPEIERKLFSRPGVFAFVFIEILAHSLFVGCSIYYRNLDGIYFSLLLAFIFGLCHIQNLRYRKYCLAKWSFDGTAFHVRIKDDERMIDLRQPFCVSTTTFTFSRRYSPQKHPFIMLWKPGHDAAYEDMNGFAALKKFDILIIPYNESTFGIFKDKLPLSKLPAWPRSAVFTGIR